MNRTRGPAAIAAARIRAYVKSTQNLKRELRNWPEVLLLVLLGHVGWNRGTFMVASRSGVTVRAPNNRLSRWAPIEVIADDAYQLRTLRWSDSHARRVVLDIGAHVGSFTCALAQRLPGATFICVEPLPSSVGWLSENLKRNGLTDRAVILAAAVAGEDGEARLFASNLGSTEASLDAELWESWRPILKIGSERGTAGGVLVRTMSFDTIMTQAGGRAEIVKLDCEGGEYAAILKGSTDAWSGVNQLFLEYHAVRDHSFDQLRDRLATVGLDLVWVVPSAVTGMGISFFSRANNL